MTRTTVFVQTAISEQYVPMRFRNQPLPGSHTRRYVSVCSVTGRMERRMRNIAPDTVQLDLRDADTRETRLPITRPLLLHPSVKHTYQPDPYSVYMQAARLRTLELERMRRMKWYDTPMFRQTVSMLLMVLVVAGVLLLANSVGVFNERSVPLEIIPTTAPIPSIVKVK